MFVRYLRVRFPILIMFAISPHFARAADITDYVPQDALGFAVVRNMSATSSKLENLARMFQAPLPSPLEYFKVQTGLGESLQEDGDLLVALLPPRDEFGSPGPMALVPVTDYAAFVKALDGDPSGEVCPVTVAEQDVLVARRGDYAVFMNPDYREEMQRIVAADPQPLEPVAALGDWFARNNGAIVLLPAGADMLLALASQELASGRTALEQQFEELNMQDELATLRAAFEVYGKLLSFIDDEVTAAALGVQMDDAGNFFLGVRGVARPDGRVAHLGDISRGQNPLAGVPAGPFVVAGGTPWPAELSEAVTQFSIELMKSMPDLYGLRNASEEDLQKVKASFNKAVQGLRHFSFVMRPGEGEEPIYSNIFMLLDVDDAAAYLENSKASMELWNEISEGEAGAAFEYEMSEEPVAGKPGLAVSMDLSAMMGEAALGPGQPGQPGQQVMEAMFGEGGKMRAYVAQVDENSVVFGYSDKARVEQMVEQLRQGEAALASAADVATTAELLPKKAPFVTYISPRGCVNWFRRMMNVMMGALGGGGFVILEYPETPPVAVAIGLEGRVIETDVVFPAKMIEGLSEYFKENL